ncbi:MAG: hypothetical protein ACRC46_14355 [Thermoguttaceae bacterium]
MSTDTNNAHVTDSVPTLRPPGTCLPWEEFRKRYPTLLGNEQQIRETWERNDAEAYFYFWQCLLSF